MCALFARHFVHRRLAIIGMVHVRALPATPKSTLTIDQLVQTACKEAAIYSQYRLDGLCIENMWDVPYVKQSGPEVTAVMTRVAAEVRRSVPASMPVGVQILAAQNCEALAVALAAGLQFIRVEGYVFGHLADEGLLDACAGPLLRYRRSLGPEAESIAILTDIKKKHAAHAITADVDLVNTAKAARFFLSDGLIVTGRETGDSPAMEEVLALRRALPDAPVIVGSGVTAENVTEFSRAGVSAAIIGSTFKTDGHWASELSEERVARFMEKVAG